MHISLRCTASAAILVLLGTVLQPTSTRVSAFSQTGAPSTAPVAAAAVPPPFLNSLRWRSIGPSRGGRAVAATGDPRNRLIAYAGTTGSGVWKTEDGGISWHNVTDGFVGTGSVGAIATAPSNPDVVYVGMGEACFRGDASHGDGVYRSDDAGRTWRHLGLAATRQIARLVVDPKNPDVVFVAAFGDGFGPNGERGVYRSRNGGRSWDRVLFRGPDIGAADIVIDPSNPQVLYATLLEFRRYPWGLRSAGPGTAIYKTTDGGDTWTDLTTRPGLPRGLKGRIGITLAPARPSRVWALIDAGLEDRGLYRSDNAGETWTRVSEDARLTGRAWYYNHVFADAKNPDTVYVLTEEFYRSNDGGRTVTRLTTPHDDYHDLWIDPNDPQHLIEASDTGGLISFDGGRSWTSALSQSTGQFYHVITDNQFPYRVYGAQQDNGSISVPSRSDFGAISEIDWRQEAAGEGGYLAVHPADPAIVFGGDHHWLYRMDHRTHRVRDISPRPDDQYGWGTAQMKYRFQWTYPVVLSPHNPDVLYATGQVVFRSTNQGESWDVISPDLTRADPKTLEQTPRYGQEDVGPYWGPVTRDSTGAEWYATIFAFAESPASKGVLWTGSDDGYVQLSRDDGKTWTNVTPPGLPEFALISIIEPSRRDAGTAYVAATRYKLQDRQPYLFKTSDFGRTWSRITSGIPDGDFTRVIREDPTRSGLLYAGTETGVYVSFDDGARWQSLRLNLPVAPVHDLVVKDGDLIAATHGRSFWILDEVELLRQFDQKALTSRVHLFAPRPVIRFREDADTPLRGAAQGTHVVAGENPPAGAVFHYYLAHAPEGPVTITITDSKARVVRRFESGVGPERFQPRTAAGANRFVWDLRYPDPEIIPGTIFHRRPIGPLPRQAITRFRSASPARRSANGSSSARIRG